MAQIGFVAMTVAGMTSPFSRHLATNCVPSSLSATLPFLGIGEFDRGVSIVTGKKTAKIDKGSFTNYVTPKGGEESDVKM